MLPFVSFKICWSLRWFSKLFDIFNIDCEYAVKHCENEVVGYNLVLLFNIVAPPLTTTRYNKTWLVSLTTSISTLYLRLSKGIKAFLQKVLIPPRLSWVQSCQIALEVSQDILRQSANTKENWIVYFGHINQRERCHKPKPWD